MKNKKLTYLLLPLVIGVWGIIIFRVFDFQNEEIKTVSKTQSINDTLDLVKVVPELIANYADPFLKNKLKKTVLPKKVNVFEPPKRNIIPRNREVRNTTVRRNVQWPEINYNGLLSDSSQKIIGLLEINKKNFIVNSGISVQSINILHLYPDSIVLTFKSDTQTVSKLSKMK